MALIRRAGLRGTVADKSRPIARAVRGLRLNMINSEDEMVFCGRRQPLLHQDLIGNMSDATPDFFFLPMLATEKRYQEV